MDKKKKQKASVFSDQMDKNEKTPRRPGGAIEKIVNDMLKRSSSEPSSLKLKLPSKPSLKLKLPSKPSSEPSSLKLKLPSKPSSEPSSLTLPPKPPSTKSNKLYFFFWHAYSPVMYSLYEIPMSLLHPPSKDNIRSCSMNPKLLYPIIQLKTGKYPDGMCCVELDSVLYFLGGEMNFDNPYIDEDVKKELVKNVKRDVFPQDVYYFDLNLAINYSEDEDLPAIKYSEDTVLPVATKSMNSGKANPLAFVADGKIYVIGSTHQNLDENFTYFEMFDPEVHNWIILPNPPIRNVNTMWVAHVVVGRKALIVAWQQEKERLYCFNLDTHEWSNTSIPDYLGNFSGNTEFVKNNIYGCYYDTVAAIAPSEEEEEDEEVAAIAPSEEEEEDEEVAAIAPSEEEEEDEEVAAIAPSEEEEEDEEVAAIAPSEEEEEEEAEENELQQLFKHHRLHQVSEEMGMDATLNVHPQVQYSSSLLRLRNMYFCYVRTGMHPHPDPDLASDLVIGDDKKRFISIVVFKAGQETYKKDDTRFFKANFIRSGHYEVNTPFPNEGFIKGCYYLRSGYPESSKQISV